MAVARERYADFGQNLATEKLTELHGCGISREALLNWMIEDWLWIDRRHRLSDGNHRRISTPDADRCPNPDRQCFL